MTALQCPKCSAIFIAPEFDHWHAAGEGRCPSCRRTIRIVELRKVKVAAPCACTGKRIVDERTHVVMTKEAAQQMVASITKLEQRYKEIAADNKRLELANEDLKFEAEEDDSLLEAEITELRERVTTLQSACTELVLTNRKERASWNRRIEELQAKITGYRTLALFWRKEARG
jgi:DNA repair exonuclease SbcCD ATPase subunit